MEPQSEEALLDRFFSLEPASRRREFLDTREAALWCGHSRRAVQNWAQDGAIATVHVGGSSSCTCRA